MSEASKIRTTEAAPRLAAPPALETAIPAMKIITQRGPVGTPVKLLCPEDFKKFYGRYVAYSEGPQSVEEFFRGGRYLWCSRVVHYTDITNPASATAAKASTTLQTVGGGSSKGRATAAGAAPYNLVIMGDNPALEIATDLTPLGTKVVMAGVAAALTEASVWPLGDQDGKTDVFKVHGEEFTVTYPAGTTTAALACVAINMQVLGISVDFSSGQIIVTTDQRGTGATLERTGGDSDIVWDSGEKVGTGDCADLRGVTVDEWKTVIEASIGAEVTVGGTTNFHVERKTAGLTAYVEILAASSADTLMGLDNAQHFGTTDVPQDTLLVETKDPWNASGVTVQVADAQNGVAADLDFYVLEDGVVSETWHNLSTAVGATRYWETVLNDDTYGSDLVQVTDQLLTGTKRPANGTSPGLAGGNDGLSGLVDADYVGSQAGGTGLYAFDTVSDMTLQAVPGVATAAVVAGLQAYEIKRRGQVFTVYDLPDDCTYREAVAYMTSLGLLNSTGLGAIYWPAKGYIMNPSSEVFGAGKTIEIPTSASVLAAIARADSRKPGGVYEQPAGLEWGDMTSWVGCQHQEDTENPDVLEVLADVRINGITKVGHGKFYANDGFCLRDGSWGEIHQRRGVSYIERSMSLAMLPAKNRNNTQALRSEIRRVFQSFLEAQFSLGAFDGDTYAEAFWIDVSTGLNTAAVRRSKKLKARVGLAMVNSAAVIEIEFTADERGVESRIITG